VHRSPLFRFLIASAAAALASCSTPSAMVPNAASALPAAQPSKTAGASEGDVVAGTPRGGGVRYRDLGAASPSARLALSLTLRYRNEAGLRAFITRQSAPGGPHRWLTNEQFLARYAPSAQTYAHVLAALRRGGLTIAGTYANRTVVDASGSVAAIDRLFATDVHRVDQQGYGARYVNVRAATAPPDLAGTLLAVDGLSTLTVVHADYARVPRARSGEPHASAAAKFFGPVSTATGLGGYAPLAFETAYDFPVSHVGTTAYDGSGRAAGIVIDADWVDGDLAAFEKQFHIVQKGARDRVAVDGGAPPNNTGLDTVEATLDVETIAANAPGAKLYVYGIPTLATNHITDAYNRAVSDDLVDAVDSSFGGCESLLGRSVTAWNAIAEQGAAKGITFSASTGDHGGSLCVSAPASSKYFAALGGTSLLIGSHGAWFSETAWDGSGGGVSKLFAIPSWQEAFAGTDPLGRNLPDVALDADPVTGTAFYLGVTGGWNSIDNPIGGTSLSSPLFVAGVTEIDQVKSERTGLSSQGLFTLAQTSGYANGETTYFHDIVEGSNGPFFAGPGYDLVTGIGSPDFWNLAQVL